ncbi:bacteriohemerythrin [bacterium BMS3Abin04]|nr:bacteriohemerythrin [bacterium BMS3Abin04]
MKILPWHKDYSVNISIIDKQHKNANAIVNDLFDAAQKKNYKEIKKLMKEFIKELQEHFDTEEKLMKEYNDLNFFSHKLEHDRVMRKYEKINDQIQKKKYPNITPEFFESFERWFKNHLLFKDYKLGAFLKKKGVK